MKDYCLITGGAGFIGTNLADYCLSNNRYVTIFDNFSRPGSHENVRWLKDRYGGRLKVMHGDVRQGGQQLQAAIDETEVVFHLAAQVAVTTSVTDPRADFEVNAIGTFNVLEAVRLSRSKPIVLYSSTNKVYGKMADVNVKVSNGRHAYEQLADGVSETRPLDFYSPYGCSKGIGDQYVIDYARIYGLKTVVFRQSCIYGAHQFGIEDQGWVAWFIIRALQNQPLTIYGDGKQVRDVLHVDDLIAAFDSAVDCIGCTAGKAYNIGGGPYNTLSLFELIKLIEQRLERKLKYIFADPRPGDQLVFVSDIRKAWKDFGWKPEVSPTEGVDKLLSWLRQNENILVQYYGSL